VRCVVSDTGPLLHLTEADAFALVRLAGDRRLVLLEVHGSLGIVLWAAAVGHLDRAQADQTLARLATSSLWISNRILAEARSALDEIF
jgi:hypothetical protein